jgi:hypothetical protein
MGGYRLSTPPTRCTDKSDRLRAIGTLASLASDSPRAGLVRDTSYWTVARYRNNWVALTRRRAVNGGQLQ